MKRRKDMKFNDIIKSMIVEQGRYEILKKTYAEPKKRGDEVKPPRINLDVLDKIILADPTTRRDGNKIKKAGSYSTWLIKQYLNLTTQLQDLYDPEAKDGGREYQRELKEKERLFFEDLYKITEDLQKFDRFKVRLPVGKRDINNHTIDSLYNAVADFSLEMATTTKAERKEEHPGGKTVYDGPRWRVVEISDSGELGKEAACFYGGYNQETRWCTSSPGLDWAINYLKDGPLYVLLDKSDKNVGVKTGLPKTRYQFHFQRNQFMDSNDQSINLVDFLIKQDDGGLKDFFKPEFMKGLIKQEGTSISVEYPRDSASKFIALYGFKEFFDSIPLTIQRLDFIKSSSANDNLIIKIPKEIKKFKDLTAIHFKGIINSLPKEIGKLDKLIFISVPDNPKLKSLPDEIANIKDLAVINVSGCPEFKLSTELAKKLENKGVHIMN